jgi:hypothetical protein
MIERTSLATTIARLPNTPTKPTTAPIVAKAGDRDSKANTRLAPIAATTKPMRDATLAFRKTVSIRAEFIHHNDARSQLTPKFCCERSK